MSGGLPEFSRGLTTVATVWVDWKVTFDLGHFFW